MLERDDRRAVCRVEAEIVSAGKERIESEMMNKSMHENHSQQPTATAHHPSPHPITHPAAVSESPTGYERTKAIMVNTPPIASNLSPAGHQPGEEFR